MDKNIKSKSIKKNFWRKYRISSWPWNKQRFLKQDAKGTNHKRKKIVKLGSINLKDLYSSKDISKKWKDRS